MSDQNEQPNGRRWPEYAVVVLLFGIVAGLAANLIFQILQENRDDTQTSDIDRIDQAQVNSNTAAVNTLLEAERLECLDDLESRIEGRQRGITLRVFGEVLISALAVSPLRREQPELVDDLIARLQNRVELIDILMLPDCEEQSAALREHLGVKLPPLDELERRRRGGDASAAPSGGG